jgi:hypothetical protein
VGAVEQDISEEFSFSLMHPDVHRQDLLGTPGGHACPNEYTAGANILTRRDQRIFRGPDSLLR